MFHAQQRVPALTLLFAVALTIIAPAARAQSGPTPGQNVNMVSGTQWPGGDPFLQRQNEPSIAVSSRNSMHLLAGANDYRTVDLNFLATGETGDAWLGVFKSFDGGATWQSTLFPGYPLDRTPEGLASPLKTPTQFNAASDPVVRAGTNGLFFYSGIAFNRGTNNGVVFVSRFMDLNNKENGAGTSTTINSNTDPIRYISTAILDSGSAGQFLDKPWLAVDIPRGTATCTVSVPEPGAPGGSVTQTIPAGNVYMAWADFVGNTLMRTKIYFSRSLDCGATWSTPIKLSEGYPLNQGVTLAVDPASGNVYVAWRTVAAASTPDGLTVAKSTNQGQSFSTGVTFLTLPSFNSTNPAATASFFDENTLTTTSGGPEIRTTAFPSMAIDGCGQIYIAWSQRDPQSMGDARVMMSTSMDGVNWTTPFRVDNNPISDDYADNFSRGSQLMPSLTFSGGKLMLLYYDLRLDHTLGAFAPAYPNAYNFSADGFPVPDPQGRLVLEQRVGVPEPSKPIFGPFVNDAGLTAMRHIVDVRVAQFTPASACPSGVPNGPGSFSTARVSQYRFGTTGLNQSSIVQQLEVNPPDLPMFEGGTAPFLGDYVDIAGTNLKPNGSGWVFDTAPEPAPVHIATWTDNRDVQPPTNGNWTQYTPILPGQSVFDPTQTRPPCDQTATASRNQNIYSSRITQGLAVSSPQTSKPLSTTLQRAFVILVQNFTPVEKSFQLTIANQPRLANGAADPSGFASFVATSNPPPAVLPAPTTQITVNIGPHNGITRPLFALSSNPTASLTVNVQEINASGIAPNGLSGFVVLNADGTVPGLIDPDNAPTGTTIVGVEVYNPNVSSPNVSSPNVSSPNVSSPNVSSPNVSSPNVSSPNVSSQSFTNTLLSNGAAVPNVSSPNVSSPNVSSPNVSSPNVSSPNVSSPNVSSNPLTTSAPISDANYTVTNVGNTYTSYHIQLVSAQPVTSPLELLVNKIYATPVAVGCSLGLQQANVLLSDVNNPPIQNAATFIPTDTATDPNQARNGGVTNTTFTLAPGEQGLITLRGPMTTDTLTAITQGQLAPVVTSQAANTNTNTVPFSFPGGATTGGAIFIFTGLPDAVVGVPYTAQVQAFGGTVPYTYTVLSGSLSPAALNSNTGVISFTPVITGIVNFVVQVKDASIPANTASRALSIRSIAPLTITTTSPLPAGTQGVGYGPVSLAATGGFGTYAWSVTGGNLDGLTLSAGGVLSGTPTANGTFTFTATVQDGSSPMQVANTPLTFTIAASALAGGFTTQPSNTNTGQVITPSVKVLVQDNFGAVIPGVNVTMSIGSGPAGAVLSGTLTQMTNAVGVATFPDLSVNLPGTYTLKASFAGFSITSTSFSAAGFVATAGNMNIGRVFHTATPILGGRVLIVGGQDTPTTSLNTAALYDPIGKIFPQTNIPMASSRAAHTATFVPGLNQVWVTGGQIFLGTTPQALNTTEVFDGGTASSLGSGPVLVQVRAFHTATLLNDGTILIAGGRSYDGAGNPFTTNTTEILHPVGGFTTPGPPMIMAREMHSAVLLPNGKVLIFGGRSTIGGSPFPTNNNAEVYDPVANTFSLVGPAIGAYSDTADLLATGLALLAGGAAISDQPNALTFNPNSSTFTNTGNLNTARHLHASARLNFNQVLLVGGSTGCAAALVTNLPINCGNPTNSAELYDSISGTFRTTGSLSLARSGATATLLNDGTVLVTGGWTGNPTTTSTAELYIPVPSVAPSAPSGLTATLQPNPPAANPVLLSWNAGMSAVLGYNVYRGTTSGGPYTKLNTVLVTSLTYTDITTASGQTYFYVVTAVANLESGFSNEAQAIVP